MKAIANVLDWKSNITEIVNFPNLEFDETVSTTRTRRKQVQRGEWIFRRNNILNIYYL